MSDGPLAGVRIIAVEQFGAGPFGTLHLADMGADVIKIEDPHAGGDVSRYVPPRTDGTDSLYFEAFNRNKRSLLLDLKSSDGREIFRRLVATSDAVFNNVRADGVERLGLTYDQLKDVNPKIVCVSLSGYGRSGADALRPGYDALVQAETGWAALTGDPDGPPVRSGLSLADYSTGMMAALGLMIGIFNAQRTGVGCDVDTSLLDTALASLSYQATWFLSAGIETPRRPMSAHPTVVPFQFFETCDGYIAITCPKEKFFRALVDSLDLPELHGDTRFSTFTDRAEHREELLAILNAQFKQRSTQAWLDKLGNVVPCAPVRSLADALEAEALAARGMLASFLHPTLGPVRSVGTPLKVGSFEPTYRPGPRLGADTTDILHELGYDDERIATLQEGDAFGHRSHAS